MEIKKLTCHCGRVEGEVKMPEAGFKKIIIGFGNVSNKSKNNKIDLNKTLYLKTAKIENEWIIRFTNDILDGWTYLIPLSQGIWSNCFIVFFKVPEKLHQRLFFVEILSTSLLVKQV